MKTSETVCAQHQAHAEGAQHHGGEAACMKTLTLVQVELFVYDSYLVQNSTASWR